MADKNFGVKGINFISDPGTPTISIASSTISYAGSLNLNADTVAISTNVSIGGSVVSNIIVSNSYSVGIGTTILTEKLNISGNANISGVVSATSFVGSGSSLTGLVSNQLTSVDTNYPYYILLTRSQTGTSTTIASSYNYIYYNPNSKYLGIGTDTPTANLDVNGTGRFVGTVTAPTFQGTATTATTALGFSTTASINTTGIITATDFDSLSDFNLKTNIQQIEDSLAKVIQIRGVTFNWKETNRSSAGVIAQEVEKVLPELVNGEETKTVNYNGVIGALVEAVKELKAENDILKERLDEVYKKVFG